MEGPTALGASTTCHVQRGSRAKFVAIVGSSGLRRGSRRFCTPMGGVDGPIHLRHGAAERRGRAYARPTRSWPCLQVSRDAYWSTSSTTPSPCSQLGGEYVTLPVLMDGRAVNEDASAYFWTACDCAGHERFPCLNQLSGGQQHAWPSGARS